MWRTTFGSLHISAYRSKSSGRSAHSVNRAVFIIGVDLIMPLPARIMPRHHSANTFYLSQARIEHKRKKTAPPLPGSAVFIGINAIRMLL